MFVSAIRSGRVWCLLLSLAVFVQVAFRPIPAFADEPARCDKPTFSVVITLCGADACSPGALTHRMGERGDLPAGEQTYRSNLRIRSANGRKILSGFIVTDLHKIWMAGYSGVRLRAVPDPGQIEISGLANARNQRPLKVSVCLFVAGAG